MKDGVIKNAMHAGENRAWRNMAMDKARSTNDLNWRKVMVRAARAHNSYMLTHLKLARLAASL